MLKIMQKFLVSLPYIHPLCPLNFNHAKLFVVADVVCRYQRMKGKAVIFPIASHYSGNTAHKTVEALTQYFLGENNIQDDLFYKLHVNFYKTPRYILETFSSPNHLLDYYTHEIYWELKSLDISADYDFAYNTSHEDFSVFIKSILKCYKKNDILIKNNNNDLALNYNDLIWKEKCKKLINKTRFNTHSHKKNVLSSMKNVRPDWKLLRNTGFGVKYQNQIIDPMFDSELFTIFDLYMHFKDEFKMDYNNIQEFFDTLLQTLYSGYNKSQNSLIDAITSYLPCNVFVCEEHLKNWVVKKFYAESILLNSKYQTKKYIFIGMGILDGKRMSASKNHAILSKDLISQYGAKTARLILLLSGGNIAKSCSYDHNLPSFANKLMRDLSAYLIYLISESKQYLNNLPEISSIGLDEYTIIEEHINLGYYRQAIIELFVNIPKKNRKPDQLKLVNLLSLYRKYLDIFFPGFFNNLK